jgi:hypothetical protein
MTAFARERVLNVPKDWLFRRARPEEGSNVKSNPLGGR